MTALALIVAVAQNGVIGRANALPWRIPEDLAYFKRVTLGHPVIMGRRTYESIGRPLPGRQNWVVTSDRAFDVPGVERAASLGEALAGTKGADWAFVIGGARLFMEALTLAARLYVTEIHQAFDGDVLFPPIPPTFREVARQAHVSAHGAVPFDFVVYERVAAPQ